MGENRGGSGEGTATLPQDRLKLAFLLNDQSTRSTARLWLLLLLSEILLIVTIVDMGYYVSELLKTAI